MGGELQDLTGKLIGKLSGWVEALVLQIPNITVAILVFLLFYGLAKVGTRLIDRFMARVSDNKQIQGLLSRSAYIAILAAGLFVALGVLELDKTVTSLLAGAGILGLALGFAFQDLGANLISGIYMAIRRPFRVGDLIETNGFLATVDSVSLRSTRLRSFAGQHVLIPNKQIFENPITNFTSSGQRRLDLSGSVSYGDDLEEVRDVTIKTIQNIPGLDTSREVEFFYEEFGGSSINYTLRMWLNECGQANFLGIRSEAIIAIKKAYDAHGFTIPFPIRTLDFGIVGGDPLAEHLPWDKMANGPAHRRQAKASPANA